MGIGASAGGLASIEAFLSAMPADDASGMSLVFVQHLAPDHKSILTELVQRYTRMSVHEVRDGMLVEPNSTYIIPPNRDMALLNGVLQLLEPSAPRGLRLPIDYFFRSLALDQRERAICVVLSGTGSDGTLGVRAVKGEGGLAMAQSPESTNYDSMPRSAIATGLVDFVLPPAEMPAQLVAYVRHPFVRGPRPAAAPQSHSEEAAAKLHVLLRDRTGHDFSGYKQNTFLRRVERRMALSQVDDLQSYIGFVQRTPAEIDGLFRDLLIGVTSFFRDPEAFATLSEGILPDIVGRKSTGGTIRAWSCGCSTGEEAYSLAILLQESVDTASRSCKVQVFATDIDRSAIEQARAGYFPASIAADVPPERLSRYFVQEETDGGFRVRKSIRDLVVLSEQDVIRDPPFSRLDLISCRNLLIYLSAELQAKLIPLFHYALNPEGILFLGTSESVGEFQTLFAPVDRKGRTYIRRTEVGGQPRAELPMSAEPPRARRRPILTRRADLGADASGGLRALTEQALLDHYAQAGVLVNGRGDILYIWGRTGKYLEPAPGDPAANILQMAREGLLQQLTAALRQAVSRGEAVSHTRIRVRENGGYIAVNLSVRPVADQATARAADTYLVVLEEAPVAASEEVNAPADGSAGDPGSDGRVSALEQELRAKEEYLQSTIEEMETANEELKSTNEELQSVNEELQSTNEELETSKEELQSVNEELVTVNAELHAKVADLSRANNDMNNLLAGTGVATIFVDLGMCVSRFTPSATKLVNFIQTDIGRPIAHIVSNFVDYDGLVDDVRVVMESLIPRESEVRTKSGECYVMRIRPYRTLDNVIEGAVLTFVDITNHKKIEAQMRLTSELVEANPDIVIRLDAEDTVVYVNPAGRLWLAEADDGSGGAPMESIRAIAATARATGRQVVVPVEVRRGGVVRFVAAQPAGDGSVNLYGRRAEGAR